MTYGRHGGCGRMSFFLRYTNEKAAGGNPHDSFSFSYEGGDSFEWFINYLSYSIGKKCEQSMSIF